MSYSRIQHLTLNCEQGYEKRRTFPKSSPVTRRFLSLDLLAALTSVPSEPSDHKPEEQREALLMLFNGREDAQRKEGEDRLTEHLEAQSAGVGGPLDVPGGLHTHHLFAH